MVVKEWLVRTERLEIVFDGEALDDMRALELIFAGLDAIGARRAMFGSHGRELGRADLEAQVMASRRFPTDLRAENYEFRFGGSVAWKHTFVMVTGSPGDVGVWESWVNRAMGMPGFVQSWISQRDYDYWQNAEDPLEYSGSGRSCEHLPLISSGAPPPLDRVIIDTSRNPGRRIIRSGYVEGIGAVMWLSPLFWQRVRRQRNDAELVEAGWHVTALADGNIKVDAAMNVFTEQGDSAEQARLRAAIYG
jgi:hypothetical protein